MSDTETSVAVAGEGDAGSCFHPELAVPDKGDAATCFHPGLAVTDKGDAGICFHPEHDEDLALHTALTTIDAHELAFLRAAR